MLPTDPQTPADDPQQPNTTPAAEPAPEAPASTEPSIVDQIAAAVGTEPAQPEAVEEPAAPAEPEKLKAETPEEQEARLDAEAKALGLTKPDTTARFKELSRAAARAKELEPLEQQVTELRERVAQQQEVFDHLESQGVTGEQFGQAVMVLSCLNSGDPVKLQYAYEQLGQQMATIAKQLGLEAPGVDPLAAHPDLQEAVLDGMDRKLALEVAQGRQLRQVAAQHSGRQAQADTQSREMAAFTREAQALEARLRATDPQFDAKWAILQRTTIPLLVNVPLNQRARAFEQAYASLQLPASPAVPAQKRPDPANPGRPAMGAGAKVPTNPVDAIMLGLGLG